MRYGIVYFDAAIERRRVDPRDKNAYVQAREGWASIAGTTAFRIDRISELPSDVIWITNLDFTSYLKNNLGGSPNFVPYYYLKTDIAQIAAEIGAHPEHERVNVIVECLAEVFARTMRLAEQEFSVKGIGVGPKKKKLEHAIAGAIGRQSQVMDASLNKVMEQAFQRRNQVIGQTIPYEWWQCTLRRNRYEHAHDTLSVRVPSTGNWEYLDASRLPSGKQRVDWAINNDLPIVVHVRVADGKGLGAVLTSFGNKGRTTIAREWVSAPELCWLARYYSSIDIDAAFVCNDGYLPQREIERFPAANEFCLASVSMGLLAENFLAVLMEPSENPLSTAIYYPSCVWYSAVDRFIMFSLAYRIAKASGFGDPSAGFKIHSYGFGNIQIATPHEKIDELTDLAAGLGLEVPSTAYWKRTMQHRLLQTEQAGA